MLTGYLHRNNRHTCHHRINFYNIAFFEAQITMDTSKSYSIRQLATVCLTLPPSFQQLKLDSHNFIWIAHDFVPIQLMYCNSWQFCMISTVRCMKTLHFSFIESRVSFIQKALTFSWKLSPNSHQILLAHNLQLPLNIKHQLPLGSSGIHLGCLCVFGIIFSEGVNAISCNTILQLLVKIRKTTNNQWRSL